MIATVILLKTLVITIHEPPSKKQLRSFPGLKVGGFRIRRRVTGLGVLVLA